MQPLAEAGVDVFDCSTRRFWEPAFEGSDLGLAGWVRKLSGKPTMMVGSLGVAKEVLEKDAMDAIRRKTAGGSAEETGPVPTIGSDLHMLPDAVRHMEAGECDLLGVGRMLISNPDLVNRLRAAENVQDLKSYRTEDLLTLNYRICCR